jgi:predicted nucleic acid-binding protein
MPENVIVNTSPVFYLHRLRLLELLNKFYGTIIVPQAVIDELNQGKVQGADVPNLKSLPWVVKYQFLW